MNGRKKKVRKKNKKRKKNERGICGGQKKSKQ